MPPTGLKPTRQVQAEKYDAIIVLDGTIAINYKVGFIEHVLELAGYGSGFNAGGLGDVRLVEVDTRRLGEYFDLDSALAHCVLENLPKLLILQSKKQLEHLQSQTG
jgi:hypothetical protein